MQPVIKWSGSKRSQAQNIVSYIPDKKYETYYEPFCGSCAILAYILENENIANKFNSFICSDLNRDLIESFNLIKYNPEKVVQDYFSMWNDMNKDENSIDDKKKFFESVRSRLNKIHNPSDFIFVMRTTTNGMPRYNKKGDFNNSFHVTREGITPDKFEKIVFEWNSLLLKYNVQFVNQSFTKVNPSENDFIYLDPPYANVKGMYFGGFDNTVLFDFLDTLECDWIMSYDGIAGNQNLITAVPETLYKRHMLIDNGNSSFRRVIGNDKNCNVQESLYLSFEPEDELFLF
jgi:DNA adenine methylase